MKLYKILNLWYILIIGYLPLLFIIISYFKLFVELQILLGLFLTFSIIVFKLIPMLYESNSIILKQLAINEVILYSISLICGIFYLNTLISMDLIDNFLKTLLIIPFFFLMWPFHSGFDFIGKKFSMKFKTKERKSKENTISEQFMARLLLSYLIIIIFNFIISLYFLGQYNQYEDLGNVIGALFIFFGGDFMLVILITNLNKYWQKTIQNHQPSTKSRLDSIMLSKKFYNYCILPMLIIILLISVISLFPYLFLPHSEYLIIYLFYNGFKVFLILYFRYFSVFYSFFQELSGKP